MGEDSSKIWIDIDRTIALYTPRVFRLIAIASGVMSIALSIIYIVALLYPQMTSTGYINGYVSLVSYNLYYITNYKPIRLINLDVIKTVTIATVIYISSLLAMSIAALLYLKRRVILSAATIYGVSLSLVVANGVVRFLTQAFKADTNILLAYANSNIIRIETLAGTIEFIGMSIVKTFSYHILFTYSIILQILLTILVILSVSSIVWILYIYDKIYVQRKQNTVEIRKTLKIFKRLPLKIKILTSIAITSLLFIQIEAAVFTYNPITLTATPTPQPITLNNPPHNYVCTSLTRINRTAITYTDFETYPLLEWDASGGIWSLAGGVPGAKGNVLLGDDNNRGIGSASHYYYNVDLSGYSSLWIITKTRWASRTGWYGVSIIHSGKDRLYTVEIYTTGYIEIWSYNVEATGWRRLAYNTIPGYSRDSWYILVVNYTVKPGAIDIEARVYDSTGRFLTSVSTSSTGVRRFNPAYIGVEIDGVAAYFDDFIIAISDPRSIVFRSLVSGMVIEVWDDLGILTSSGVAIGDTLQLSVVHDVVIGRGVNGKIVVRYPDSSTCLIRRSSDAILGGDVYILKLSSLSYAIGVNKTSASISATISGNPSISTKAVFIRITNSDSKSYYIRLLLDPSSNLNQLTANISLASDTSTLTNITLANGVIISDRTSWIEIKPSSEASAILSAYFPTTGETAKLYILLQYCTLPQEQGACTYYPIELNLSGLNDSDIYTTFTITSTNNIIRSVNTSKELTGDAQKSLEEDARENEESRGRES